MDDPTQPADRDLASERGRAQRSASQVRHAEALNRLMTEREDLRGVHALADLVADSLRWSA